MSNFQVLWFMELYHFSGTGPWDDKGSVNCGLHTASPGGTHGGSRGKINWPQTELKKKLFKHWWVLNGEKQLRHQVVRAVIDEGLITRHHLKKWASSARGNITLSGKKCGKLLLKIWLAQKEKVAMEVEVPSKPARTSEPQPKRQKKIKPPQDVDMENLENES
ncbi:uncharacterized protein C11orf98-like [Sciurus carolinensis]|uniref:uncharacterized protein C11orf98-like n=1 Tax=Sciurus carolinensis TaxID=30640 RepID=UPI001FB2411F|nr:uncharacterized protein C11orf98-like [Sciurus carolinensis]